MKSRRVFAHIAFAFLLLFSQQLGMTHAVSHLSSDATPSSSQKNHLPSEMQCGQCLAFAALGSGLTSSPLSVIFFPVAAGTAIAALLVKPRTAALRAFNSRAPPVLV